MSQLVEASCNGDVSTVRTLLASGVNVDVVENNTTALIEASRIGHFALVRLILEAGASINYRNNSGSTALMVCIAGGYVDVVEILLAKGADVNICDKHGYTALIDSSLHGHSELVKLLLNAGSDPRHRNEDGVSAFDCAKTVEIRNAIEDHVRNRKLRDRATETQNELSLMKQRIASNSQSLSGGTISVEEKDRVELLSAVFADFQLSSDVTSLAEIAVQQMDLIEGHAHLKEYHDCFRHNLLCASYAFLCCGAGAGLCGSLDEFPPLLNTAALLFKEPVVTYLARKLSSEDHTLSVLRFTALTEQQQLQTGASQSPLQFIDHFSRELTLIQRSQIEHVAATALRAHDTMLQYKQQVALWLEEDGVKSNVQIKAVVDVKQFLDNLLTKSGMENDSEVGSGHLIKYDNVEQMIQLALGLNEEASINGILLCDALKQIRMLETQSVISLTEITTVCESELESNAGNNERDVDEVARLISKNRRDVCCLLM